MNNSVSSAAYVIDPSRKFKDKKVYLTFLQIVHHVHS